MMDGATYRRRNTESPDQDRTGQGSSGYTIAICKIARAGRIGRPFVAQRAAGIDPPGQLRDEETVDSER